MTTGPGGGNEVSEELAIGKEERHMAHEERELEREMRKLENAEEDAERRSSRSCAKSIGGTSLNVRFAGQPRTVIRTGLAEDTTVAAPAG